MAIEEMSELTKELCKKLRDRGDVNHIAEEIADVKIIYNVHDQVAKTRYFKLNRLQNSINKLKSAQ